MENGLKIHLTRKHTRIEQVDGNTMDSDRLGTGYQVFMDASDIIEQSDLSEDDKEKEKSKVLEARKNAFGSRFRDYPPWNLRS